MVAKAGSAFWNRKSEKRRKKKKRKKIHHSEKTETSIYILPNTESYFSLRFHPRRFARNGGVDATDFQRMWRDRQNTAAAVDGLTGLGVVNTAPGRREAEGRYGVDGGVGGAGIGAEKVFEVSAVGETNRQMSPTAF